MVNFDDVLNEINEFGPYQQLRLVLILIAAVVPGFITYIHSFVSPKTSFICNELPDFVPNVTHTNISYDKCHYTINETQYPCSSWSFDKTYYQSTLTEEWSMVCERSFFSSYLQMIYFSGYIVGSLLLGHLADRFGRRPIMLSSFILFIIAASGAAFGPQESFGFEISFGIYAFSRFVIAGANRGINDVAFILALETVGPRYRALSAMAFPMCFALGQVMLVTTAYFIRYWRTLSIVMIIPLLPFLGYFFVIAESPRWLIMNKKDGIHEAHEILVKIAKKNKRKLEEDTWTTFIEENKQVTFEEKESFIDIFKSPRLFIIMIVMFFCWMVSNLGFYGVSLKSTDLGVNPYMSFFFSAITEVVAHIFCYKLIEHFGRKKPFILGLLVNGIACISIYFLEDQVILTVVLAMTGKFFITMSYAIIHLYSSEVFPTSVRASCQGACSMMARLGSIIAPYIIALDDVYKGLPFLVFGASALVCTLTALVLPETSNRQLPKTMAEAENNISTMSFLPRRYKDRSIELQSKDDQID